MKCGMDITNTFKGSRHPMVDLIVDILQSFARNYGADGIKRIVLMLNFFFHAIIHNTVSAFVSFR